MFSKLKSHFIKPRLAAFWWTMQSAGKENNALLLPQNHVCKGRKGDLVGFTVSYTTCSQLWIQGCWRPGQSKVDVVGKWILTSGGGYQNNLWCPCSIISNCMTLVIRRKQKKKTTTSPSNCVIPFVWRGWVKGLFNNGKWLEYQPSVLCKQNCVQVAVQKPPQRVCCFCRGTHIIQETGLFLENSPPSSLLLVHVVKARL